MVIAEGMAHESLETILNEVEIDYMDGTKEKLDLRYVFQYSSEFEFKLLGTGCSKEYLVGLLQKNQPILIAKKYGVTKQENIKRIINSYNIKSINSQLD